MITIHKYPLILMADQLIQLPDGAVIRKVGLQRDVLTLWAEVNSDNKVTTTRNIMVFGTGHEIYAKGKKLQYLDTVFVGEFVWHVFEATPYRDE